MTIFWSALGSSVRPLTLPQNFVAKRELISTYLAQNSVLFGVGREGLLVSLMPLKRSQQLTNYFGTFVDGLDLFAEKKFKNFWRILFPFLRANRGKLHFAREAALTILWQRSSAILMRISLSLLCTAWRWRALKHVFCKKKKKKERKKKVTKVVTRSKCVIKDQGLLQIIWFHAGFRSPIWGEIFVENPASRVFFISLSRILLSFLKAKIKN